MPVLELLNRLCLWFVDVYLAVMLMVDQICEKRVIVEQNLMLSEMLTAFRTLQAQNVLYFNPESLKEIVSTAISRF